MQWFLYFVNNCCLQLDCFENVKISSHTFVPKAFKGHLMRTIYGDGVMSDWEKAVHMLSIWTRTHHLIFFNQGLGFGKNLLLSPNCLLKYLWLNWGLKKVSWEFFFSSFPQKPLDCTTWVCGVPLWWLSCILFQKCLRSKMILSF